MGKIAGYALGVSSELFRCRQMQVSKMGPVQDSDAMSLENAFFTLAQNAYKFPKFTTYFQHEIFLLASYIFP